MNRRPLTGLMLALIVSCLVPFVVHADLKPLPLGRDALAGKWKVTVTPDEDARKAGEKEFKDVLVFKGSTFTATECKKWGFETGVYEEDVHPGGIGGFTATQKSKTTYGTMKWSGLVAASELTGDIVWTKKDGEKRNFTFKGSKE